MKPDELKVGCCGFSGSQGDYYQRFRLIEIQQTFYQLPQLKTGVKWRQQAPPDFEFTLKAWQLITHDPYSPTYKRLRVEIDPSHRGAYGSFRPTPEVFSAWEQTAEFARALEAQVIVFQCPASFRPSAVNLANMNAFFNQVNRYGLRFAWEPRGGWPAETIESLCQQLNLIHCVDPFKDPPLFGDFLYFRLHGIGGYDYHYSQAELIQLKTWAAGKPAYVLFNNVYMKEDAQRFINLPKD